jgi:hypothetical protein
MFDEKIFGAHIIRANIASGCIIGVSITGARLA